MIGSEAWSSYGWREEDIFWPSQLGRSINPSSVEGFFPVLSAVGSAYDEDLCLEDILGLSHADVIGMLLGLIFFFFSLGFCFLRLSFGFLCLIFESLGFLQLFLKGCQLLLRRNQLVIGLTHEFPLILGLPLCTLQSLVNTFRSVLLVGQLFLQLGITLFSNIQGLHNRGPSFSFIIQLLVTGVGYLLKPESILDSLKRKRVSTITNKKYIYMRGSYEFKKKKKTTTTTTITTKS